MSNTSTIFFLPKKKENLNDKTEAPFQLMICLIMNFPGVACSDGGLPFFPPSSFGSKVATEKASKIVEKKQISQHQRKTNEHLEQTFLYKKNRLQINSNTFIIVFYCFAIKCFLCVLELFGVRLSVFVHYSSLASLNTLSSTVAINNNDDHKLFKHFN